MENKKTKESTKKTPVKKEVKKEEIKVEKNEPCKCNKWIILAAVCGLIIGSLVTFIVMPKRVAKLSNGEEIAIKVGKFNVTANDVYNDLKEKYATSAIFDLVDRIYLEDRYDISETDEEAIINNAQYYYDQYSQYYGKSKEEFLNENGFFSEDKFLEYLRLDYLRSVYYKEYLKKQINDSDVDSYYESNVFAPFNVEHILVKISSDVTDEQAKEKAQEILNDIKSGLSFEEAKSKYKDISINEAFEINYKSNLEKSFFDAAKSLSSNSVSDSLVKTSYGYHIINKKDVSEKPKKEDIKNDIVELLSNELREKSEYSYENVLIKMRKDADMSIIDSEIKKEYKKYTKSVNNAEEE